MEEKQITLQIDGHFITVPEGSTILEAAIKIGINIPTLCHIDLKGTCIKNNPASCRICVVEVMGRRNLAPACATRCTEGMVVKTSTLRVMNARKVVAELILLSSVIWINAFSVAVVKVFAMMYRRSEHWVPSVADSIQPSLLPLTE